MSISSWQGRIAHDVELGFIHLWVLVVLLSSYVSTLSKFSVRACAPFVIENEVTVSLK